MNLLYITDVFCPWCYGFAPVMARLAAEHPELPVRVLGGNLVDEPCSLTTMLEEHPSLHAFFTRLQETTGQPTERFRNLLEQAAAGTGPDLRMHSPAMNLPLAALRRLAPGHELEQMEAFQLAFYGQGRDVMDPAECAAIAARWLPADVPPHAPDGLPPEVSPAAPAADAPAPRPAAPSRDMCGSPSGSPAPALSAPPSGSRSDTPTGGPAAVLHAALADPAVCAAARQDAAEAEAVMGEFLIYPTLYLEHDGERILLARGYCDHDSVRAKLDDALRGVRPGPAARGAACGLDGRCCL